MINNRLNIIISGSAKLLIKEFGRLHKSISHANELLAKMSKFQLNNNLERSVDSKTEALNKLSNKLKQVQQNLSSLNTTTVNPTIGITNSKNNSSVVKKGNTNSNNNQQRSLAPIRNVSDLGFTGFGLFHLSRAFFGQEFDISKLSSDAAAFNQPTVTALKNSGDINEELVPALKDIQQDFKDFIFEMSQGTTVSMTQVAQVLQQVVKDGVKIQDTTLPIADLPPEFLKNLNERRTKPDDEIEKEFLDNFIKLSADGSINTIDFQKLITQQALTTARLLGNPKMAEKIGDTIGEVLDKSIDKTNFTKNLKDIEDFTRAFTFTVTSSRFNEDETAKFLRNTASLGQLLPNFDINDRLILATIADRINISGRSVGTSVRRLGEELRPRNNKEASQFKYLGITPNYFTSSEDLPDFQKRINDVNKKLARLFSKKLGINPDEAVKAFTENPFEGVGQKINNEIQTWWLNILGTEAVRGLRPFINPTTEKAIEEQFELMKAMELSRIIEFRETKTFSGALLQLIVTLSNLKYSVIEASNGMIGFTKFFNFMSETIINFTDKIRNNPAIGQMIGSMSTFLLAGIAVTVLFGGLALIFSRMLANKVVLMSVLTLMSALAPIIFNTSSGITYLINTLTELTFVIGSFVIIHKIVKTFMVLRTSLLALSSGVFLATLPFSGLTFIIAGIVTVLGYAIYKFEFLRSAIGVFVDLISFKIQELVNQFNTLADSIKNSFHWVTGGLFKNEVSSDSNDKNPVSIQENFKQQWGFDPSLITKEQYASKTAFDLMLKSNIFSLLGIVKDAFFTKDEKIFSPQSRYMEGYEELTGNVLETNDTKAQETLDDILTIMKGESNISLDESRPNGL